MPTEPNADGYNIVVTHTFVCQPGATFVFYISVHQDLLYLSKPPGQVQPNHRPHGLGINRNRNDLPERHFNEFGVEKARRSESGVGQSATSSASRVCYF